MDIKIFGAKLKEARENLGLTQEELVEILGKKTIASISEYENGKRKIAVVDLPDFARALHVPILYFFEDDLTEDDIELAFVEWLRTLPDRNAKLQIFNLMKQIAPHVVSGKNVYAAAEQVVLDVVLDEVEAQFKEAEDAKRSGSSTPGKIP